MKAKTVHFVLTISKFVLKYLCPALLGFLEGQDKIISNLF